MLYCDPDPWSIPMGVKPLTSNPFDELVSRDVSEVSVLSAA